MKERQIYKVFRWSLLIKAAFAVGELVTSFAVLFLTSNLVNHTVFLLTQEELTEDPRDHLANYLVHAAQHFSTHTQLFVFFYLLSHGIIKIILIIALLKDKLWAYPASLVAFMALIVYQVYRYFLTYSPWLIIITLFDILVIWLVWHEYRFVKASAHNSKLS